MRHPNILAFKDSQEVTEKGVTTLYLITEPAQPLRDVLTEVDLGAQRQEYVALGLMRVATAVSFINNDCKMVRQHSEWATGAESNVLLFFMRAKFGMNEDLARPVPGSLFNLITLHDYTLKRASRKAYSSFCCWLLKLWSPVRCYGFPQVHGNICMSSVVVTDSLDWKLHGFDLLGEHAEAAALDTPLAAGAWLVGSQYKPAEVAKSEWGVVAAAPVHAVDAWGLGCLMQVGLKSQVFSWGGVVGLRVRDRGELLSIPHALVYWHHSNGGYHTRLAGVTYICVLAPDVLVLSVRRCW